MSYNPTTQQPPISSRDNRPLGVAHLVFGLIFTGIAAIWLIGEASNTDNRNLAAGFPVVLIGAGIIGLAASVLNQRRARARLLTPIALPPELAGELPAELTSDLTETTDTAIIPTAIIRTNKDL
jgi:hypothetical protein